MSDKYKWLEKKSPRSVEQLRLWAENPRLNPEEKHLTLRDFVEDLVDDKAEKDNFYALVKSIAKDGFIPADPVVVWKHEDNGKYYVAEGNRRVIALKLLRKPDSAPKSIRSFIRKEAEKLSMNDIEKIPVNVAPSFSDAEWYINQRNSTSSLQSKWSRVQQMRWISTLYEKYDRNFDKVMSIVTLEKTELENFIRILKIKDFVNEEQVSSQLTKDEFEKASSHKFPITVLERVFNLADARTEWGIELDGINVIINSNKNSFFTMFAELIKKIVRKEINTRFTKEDWPRISSGLPKVDLTPDPSEKDTSEEVTISPSNSEAVADSSSSATPSQEQSPPILKNDPNRNRVVLSIYSLNCDSFRLCGLFNELQKIPTNRYPNHVAASIRVFLDLSVLEYISSENLKDELTQHYELSLGDIQLRKRLEYLSQNKINDRKVNKVIRTLLDNKNQFSLDVLNGYVHSNDSHYLDSQFINRFWDFLFPLLEKLLVISEETY